VFEGETLTWAAIAQACGANESRYSTRHRASTSTTKISARDKGKVPANASGSKSSRARVELIDEYEEEEHEEEEEEEEEDDTKDNIELLDMMMIMMRSMLC